MQVGSYFQEKAIQIVNNSIRSAVCVDDLFAEPYGPKNEGENQILPKMMYEAFKAQNCSLYVYKYTDQTNWEVNKNFVLRNRDLLILDWILSGTRGYEDSLNVLWDAVHLSSLPFVIVYTNHHIDDIKIQIRSFFGKYYENTEDRQKIYDEFIRALDDYYQEIEEISNIANMHDFISDLGINYKHYIYVEKEKKEGVQKEFVDEIKRHLDDKKNLGRLIKKMVELYRGHFEHGNLEDIIEFIIFANADCLPNTRGDQIRISQFENTDNCIIINNTVVAIFAKEINPDTANSQLVSPNHLYQYFADIICKRPRNFMALLALEMKALFRDNAENLGKELYEIDEVAFFHHKQNVENDEDFIEFLRDCWREQLLAFDRQHEPELFAALDDYKKMRDIDVRISEDNATELRKMQESLVKLNYFYSVILPMRKYPLKIQFGDIFALSHSEEKASRTNAQEFLLCITPHCDCIRPEEKVRGRLFFVSGTKETNFEKGLTQAEQLHCHYSFILQNNQPICIEWKVKPFTVYIPEKNNNITIDPIEVHDRGEKTYLMYIASLKENYTQRIANDAFGHATRVGINFAQMNHSNNHGITDDGAD